MQVRDIMTGHAECIPPDTTLTQAAEKMRELDCGALPICDHDRLVGMITDRDIVLRAVADGRPGSIEVHYVMTPGITCCYEDDDVERAAHLMIRKQLRRLVVLNRAKRMVGFLSLGDIAIRTRDRGLAGEITQGVSQPAAVPVTAI